MNQRLSRLEDINVLILTEEFNARSYEDQHYTYQEAAALCRDLGLERAEHRYEEFINRIESGWLAELKGGKYTPTCRVAGCKESVAFQCIHTKNERDPRTEYFCQETMHKPAFLQSMSSLLHTPNFESLTYTLGPRDIGMEDIDHFTCTVERYKAQ